MDNSNITFKLGELFCGPDGIGLGAANAHIHDKSISIKHAWATDYDKDTCETYRHNLSPDTPQSVLCQDIRELDYNMTPLNLLHFGDLLKIAQQQANQACIVCK